MHPVVQKDVLGERGVLVDLVPVNLVRPLKGLADLDDPNREQRRPHGPSKLLVNVMPPKLVVDDRLQSFCRSRYAVASRKDVHLRRSGNQLSLVDVGSQLHQVDVYRLLGTAVGVIHADRLLDSFLVSFSEGLELVPGILHRTTETHELLGVVRVRHPTTPRLGPQPLVWNSDAKPSTLAAVPVSPAEVSGWLVEEPWSKGHRR